MQSPAPQKKQKIAGRSDSSEDTKEEFGIIENIEAITEEDKKKEEESDSSYSTITENKDSPKTEGGPIKQTVTVAAEALAILGEVRVKLRALSIIYNWDGQTVLFAHRLFKLDTGL
jgi:hypothetical protein